MTPLDPLPTTVPPLVALVLAMATLEDEATPFQRCCGLLPALSAPGRHDEGVMLLLCRWVSRTLVKTARLHRRRSTGARHDPEQNDAGAVVNVDVAAGARTPPALTTGGPNFSQFQS